jgi:integrase
MAITTRKVKNKKNLDGSSSGKAGTVYDVNLKYKNSQGEYQTYGKRGFLTKPEAVEHETEMRKKLINGGYEPVKAVISNQTVGQYLETWVETHGNANLRPSTFAGYKSHIKNHIVPFIGNIPINKLTPAMIDNMLAQLKERGLSSSTMRYAQRILSVSLEAARKYGYIQGNPARDIITKIGNDTKTPEPYTIEQMQGLMSKCIGTEWELVILLSGMYGLRRNEILGLRWHNVDLKKATLSVVEQLPYKMPHTMTTVTEMAPVKSSDRTIPITSATLPYFKKQLKLQQTQKKLAELSGTPYYMNNLVVSKADGSPVTADQISANFGNLLKKFDMPHIRFHDLRHSAATNMHELTGDFYTVGQILGHSLKGIGNSLGISTNMADITARYVDVRMNRKLTVLDAYHNALYPKEIMNPQKIREDRDER